MLIGILLFITAVALFIFLKGKNAYSPEIEAKELLAKAEAEGEVVESDVEKEVSTIETGVKTDATVVEADAVKIEAEAVSEIKKF